MFSSSAQSVSNVFEEVFAGELTPEIKAFLIRQVLLQNPDGSAPSRPFMNTCNKAFNAFLKANVNTNVSVMDDIVVKERKMAAAKTLVKAARDALKTCFTLMFYRSMSVQDCLSVNDFLISYPSMMGVDATELALLTKFRNFLAASLKHLPAENNKEKHLFIAGVLSAGKMIKHITGTGQSKAVTNRVTIYETEGGVRPKPSKKGKRTIADSDDSSVASELTTVSEAKSKRSRVSVKSESSLSTAFSSSEEKEMPAVACSQDLIDSMDCQLLGEFFAECDFVEAAVPAAVEIKEEEGSVTSNESDFSELSIESDLDMDFVMDMGFDFSE